MQHKKFVIVMILLAGWISSCRQSTKFTGKTIPGDMKSAIAIVNDTSSARITIRRADGNISVFGKHWNSNAGGKTPVTMILNDDTIKVTNIKYNIDGSFLADLPTLHLIKTYTLSVIQQNETGGHKEATIEFNITAGEEDNNK